MVYIVTVDNCGGACCAAQIDRVFSMKAQAEAYTKKQNEKSVRGYYEVVEIEVW